MQELILVISRCLSKKRNKNSEIIYYRFHFLGFYKGEKIKEIHLYCDINPKKYSSENDERLSKGEDYFLWVKKKQVTQEILKAELIKYKKIV